MIKIRCIKTVWTANPEKVWNSGEVMDLSDNIAKDLISSGLFIEIKKKVKDNRINNNKK